MQQRVRRGVPGRASLVPWCIWVLVGSSIASAAGFRFLVSVALLLRYSRRLRFCGHIIIARLHESVSIICGFDYVLMASAPPAATPGMPAPLIGKMPVQNSIQLSLIVVPTLLYFLATAAVALRFYSRYLKRVPIMADDYLCVVALVSSF